MDTIRIAATLLIVAGGFGLGYAGFDFLQHGHDVGVGLVPVETDGARQFEAPIWAGTAATLGGIALLLAWPKRRGEGSNSRHRQSLPHRPTSV